MTDVTPNEATTELERWCEDAGWMQALARQLIADTATAEDLAQDAWVRTLRSGGPEKSSFRAWVGQVIRNLASTESRQRARRREIERNNASEHTTEDSTADVAQRLEAHSTVVDAVRALAEPYRSVVLLRYFDGLPPRTIAARTGTPVRTVHTQLRRALEMLRDRLGAKAGRDGRQLVALLIPLVRSSDSVFIGVGAKSILAATALICCVTAFVAWPPQTIAIAPSLAPADAAESVDATVDPEGPQDRGAASPEREAVPALDDVVSAPSVWTTQPSPTSLVGQVLDLDGAAIPDVELVFTRFGSPPPEGKPRTRTDAAGAFTLNLAHMEGGTIDVVDAEWTTVYRPILWGERLTEELTVIAAPIGRISGRVIGAAGRPLPNVNLSLHGTPPPRSAFRRSLERDIAADWKTTTDERGAFTFERAPQLPELTLHATRVGHRDAQVRLDTEREHLLIELAPSRTLTGHVIGIDGSSASGAVVFCHGNGTRCDENGAFTIDLERVSLDPTRNRHRWLVAQSPGVLPGSLRCDGEDWQDPSAWPHPLVIRLGASTLSISGRITDVRGEPVPTARVTALDQQPVGDTRPNAAIDAMSTVEYLARVQIDFGTDGTTFREAMTPPAPPEFCLHGLQDKPYRLRIEDAGSLREMTTPAIDAGSTHVELRFPEQPMWPQVAGVVVDQFGYPIEKANVSFERDRDGSPWRTQAIATSATGEFERRDLVQAAHWILVQAPQIAHPTRFDLRRYDSVDELRLVVPVCVKVQISATARTESASAIAFYANDGTPCVPTITRGNMAWGQHPVSLERGRTEVFQVPDNAVEAALLDGDQELLRFPIELNRFKLNVLSP